MKIRTTLMIEDEALKTIKHHAARLGVSVSSFMVQCAMTNCVMLDETMERLLAMKPSELAEFKKSLEGVFDNGRQKDR